MSLVLDIPFYKGSLNEVVTGITPYNTNVVMNKDTKFMYASVFGANGLLNYVRIPALEILTTFSIVLWFRSISRGNQVIYEINGNTGFSLQMTSGNPPSIGLNIGGVAGANSIIESAGISIGTWHNIVFIVNLTTDNAKVYLNNILQNTNASLTGTPTYSAQSVYVFSRNNTATVRNFNIARLMHYNHILSQKEMDLIHRSFCSIISQNKPILY